MYLPLLVTLIVLAVSYYLFVPKRRKDKIKFYRIPSKEIDNVLFKELIIWRKAYYKTSSKEFLHFIKEHPEMIFVIFRDPYDGSIRGGYYETVIDIEEGGKTYSVLYFGGLFAYTYYRGSFQLAYDLISRFASHWFYSIRFGKIPFFCFVTISYKSYVAARPYPGLFPTFVNYKDPKFDIHKLLISDVMKKMYPNQWDGKRLETGMIDFDAAEIRPEMLKDPWIKFFQDENPEYKNGKGMPCIFRLTLIGIWLTLVRNFWNRKTRSSLHPDKTKAMIQARDQTRTTAIQIPSKYEIEISSKKSSKYAKNLVKKMKSQSVLEEPNKSDVKDTPQTQPFENDSKSEVSTISKSFSQILESSGNSVETDSKSSFEKDFSHSRDALLEETFDKELTQNTSETNN